MNDQFSDSDAEAYEYEPDIEISQDAHDAQCWLAIVLSALVRPKPTVNNLVESVVTKPSIN